VWRENPFFSPRDSPGWGFRFKPSALTAL
jgi:hypothetical protein